MTLHHVFGWQMICTLPLVRNGLRRLAYRITFFLRHLVSAIA
jgi:hypothetical protein